ncbi:MAG TPA: Hint domain-containing protein [Candidatus Polarisedimenticolaceae bacterium]|nr:Hint domain-containing protein [Candidatus Polarisedimenticolaceae bacterium]
MPTKTVFGLILGVLLSAASAQAVPHCSQIDYGSCSAVCFGLGHGGCSSWSIGPCQSGSAVYTYVCSDGYTSNDWCSECSGGGGGGNGGCFLAGTQITLADGSTKPIETVVPGDRVLAYDEATGELKPDTIRKVHEPIETDFYLVVNGTLRLTPSHPVLSHGKWIAIGQLKVGDELTRADGTAVIVESLETRSDKVKVYNFAVNPYGTYLANGIIVHNKSLPSQYAEPNGP